MKENSQDRVINAHVTKIPATDQDGCRGMIMGFLAITVGVVLPVRPFVFIERKAEARRSRYCRTMRSESWEMGKTCQNIHSFDRAHREAGFWPISLLMILGS